MLKKIIVTGERRSGTTFMANFLNSQDKVVCYSDYIKTPVLVAERLKITDFNRTLTDREKNILFSQFRAESDRFNLPIYKNMDIESCRSVMDFMDEAFSSLAQFTNKDPQACGVKITSYPHHLVKLLEGEYKIIYMVRDPRDVLLSDRNRFFDSSAIKVIHEWKSGFDYTQRFKNNPNFFLVSYEDFIRKDPQLIDRLERFLGVNFNFDIKVLKMRNDLEYNDNSSFTDVKELFDTSAINRWKNHKNEEEVLLVNSILKREMKQLNLEIIDSDISLLKKAKYYSQLHLQNLKRAAYKKLVTSK